WAPVSTPGPRWPSSPRPLALPGHLPVRTDRGQLVAVVAEHELLERRRMAGQTADPERTQRANRVVEMVTVDREPHSVLGRLQVVDAGHPLQAGHRTIGLGLDRGPGQVPQLGERPGL